MPTQAPATRILDGRHDLLRLAAEQPLRYPGLLESVARGTPLARFDVLAAFPQQSLQLDSDLRVRDGDGADCGPNFLDALDRVWAATRGECAPVARGLPFSGGWLLYLGYELAAEIEPRLKLTMPDNGLPVALAVRCPLAVIVDHQAGRTIIVAEAGYAHLLDEVEADLARAPALDGRSITLRSAEEDLPQAFIEAVHKTHAYLAAGDVFQVNLSREWRLELARRESAATVYAALRQSNPAPFSGLLQWSDWAIASSSPERLVEVRSEQVQTRPIAGTRARIADADMDASISELIGHPKERAEHVMLIDLERNDLGRVCVPGSIVVDELMAIESYAHVHHIVSNVRGRLRAGTTPGAVIRAVFPGGTITGCPKVRCMEIIAELEQCTRGAYTGALGYLDNSGDLDLNILIRTLTLRGMNASLRAGAGIVIDSDAHAELAETRAKARGVLRAFGVDG